MKKSRIILTILLSYFSITTAAAQSAAAGKEGPAAGAPWSNYADPAAGHPVIISNLICFNLDQAWAIISNRNAAAEKIKYQIEIIAEQDKLINYLFDITNSMQQAIENRIDYSREILERSQAFREIEKTIRTKYFKAGLATGAGVTILSTISIIIIKNNIKKVSQ